MKALRFVVCLSLCSGAAILSRAQLPDTASDNLSSAATLLSQHHHSRGRGPTFDLEQVEEIALTANPEIHVALRKLEVVEAHVLSAGALDDPMLGYRGWGVPLKQPWNYNAGQNMFMVSQTFAGSGKRGLRTSVAKGDVVEAKAALEATRLDIRIRVRKAFYDLLRAEDGLQIHDQHVDIAQQAVAAAKIKYSVGKVPQQDVLKAEMSMTRLAEHLIHFELDTDLARARLNTLLGRDPSAPIDVRGEHTLSTQLPSIETLEKTALQSRPDLLQMQAALDKSHTEEALAKKAYSPDFTVSAGYMLMPSGSEFRNNYMVEGSINLPWLNRRKHDAEIAESKVKTTVQDAELVALRNNAFGQIQEALVEARAAQKLANVYQQSLLPQAEATLHSTVIAYENNRTEFLDLLDSQMTVIDLDLSYLQARADFDVRLADLELAVGAPIEQGLEPAPEVTQ
jgi:outer membrane protein, heavy metal efflux system